MGVMDGSRSSISLPRPGLGLSDAERRRQQEISRLLLKKTGKEIISALLALPGLTDAGDQIEVELTDDLVLGLRMSNSDTIFRGTSVDNRVGVSLGFEGVINNVFGGLFDTSALNATSSINLVLQALERA